MKSISKDYEGNRYRLSRDGLIICSRYGSISFSLDGANQLKQFLDEYMMEDKEFNRKAEQIYEIVKGLPTNEGIRLLECVKLTIFKIADKKE